MNQTNHSHSFKLLWEIFLISTKLGVTSFGGPIAHLGYFHEEYVRRRKWLDEKNYADLVALSQFLPGPASSQVGIGIGVMRAGILGGIISFVGFTFPSVIVLIIFAVLLNGFDISNAGWIHGLKIVAVAIVAQAIVGMTNSLVPDLKRKSIALFALIITLLWQSSFTQAGIILICALIGFLQYRQPTENKIEKQTTNIKFPITKKIAITCLILFFALLFLLPIISKLTGSYWITMIEHFYRAGALVFGGGHVVLPLLEQSFVPTGWIHEEAFLAGYGATQAVPGPLFTFAAYLGTVMNGWQGGLIATIAIFLPAFLLILGTLPFWNSLKNNPKIKGAVFGINAAVIGILISAFYFPIFTTSILTPYDFALAAVLFSMSTYWKLPSWIIVISGIFGGILLSFL